MTPQKTTVDWLRFRVQAEPRDVLEALRPMYGALGSQVKLKPLQRGMLGFQQASAIVLDDMPLGRMDFGGESQRGWVRSEVTGQGCEWVKDWEALDSVEALPSAEIRRLDVALTTWDGEITHDHVVAAHAAGLFTTNGRPPKLKQILSSDEHDGRTCYVGVREKSDKFFRSYEKGRELVSKQRIVRRNGSLVEREIVAIDGKKVENIYRCELELKAENRPIPWEVVERRDHYFAGAYPFCAEVLPNVESDILFRRPERAPQMSLRQSLENCRVQFGAVLFTAMHAHHGDISAVWEQVVGHQHSEALLQAGVLLVDHD